MIYRCILPQWALDKDPARKRVREGEFSEVELRALNSEGYNIYFLPNYPSLYDPKDTVDGSQIDVFDFVFVDMDLKDGIYASKESFIAAIYDAGAEPSFIVDSGNGIHVYWQVTDLDAMNFLRLQRRLIAKFKTDEAVGQIYQLMRAPGYLNTKVEYDLKQCEAVAKHPVLYTCEDMDKWLPILTLDDEEYCQQHYNKTYNKEEQAKIDDKLPLKFAKLISTSDEVKDIWLGKTDDRSKADFRLGHIMFASGFKKAEAMSVLVNTSKALARAPKHRASYAASIVDKVWAYEEDEEDLSQSVRDILTNAGASTKGTRFPCKNYIDSTAHGFRLGQVIGLVAGSGVGKTAMALNMFMWFTELNPDCDHFFVPLEQPALEIADRWRTMCGTSTHLYDRVQIISNYDSKGMFRHLSLEDIKKYILDYKQRTGRKVGCIVVDHIGALKKKGKDGENQDLMDICHAMKGFAIETNTMVVMQSQTSREKAGIGDLELDKDAAYGTVYFESYCDYLITIWQPLKRCYSDAKCPTVTAFKFCKIRHKKRGQDNIEEDVPYQLFFDPNTEQMRPLTQDEETAFDFWNTQAISKRRQDRKTDVIPYKSLTWVKEEHGKTIDNQDAS